MERSGDGRRRVEFGIMRKREKDWGGLIRWVKKMSKRGSGERKHDECGSIIEKEYIL